MRERRPLKSKPARGCCGSALATNTPTHAAENRQRITWDDRKPPRTFSEEPCLFDLRRVLLGLRYNGRSHRRIVFTAKRRSSRQAGVAQTSN